uniref:Zyg-9 protein n=2 Tax=Loa loa TaxID=7209 RepID=A0A1I7VL36_LOALO
MNIGNQITLKVKEMDEVDITDHLPPGFFGTIRSANWTERRDVLLALIDNLSQYPRIDPKIKYNEILIELKLIISKDSNIAVVTLALRTLTEFVKRLRKNFVKYIPMVLLNILEKFKEKKAAVKEAIVDCLSLVAEHCDAASLTGPICEALEKATNPNVKASIDQWIYCILCQYSRTAVPIAFIRSVTPYLVKHSKDSDPNVRERSCMVFGAILRLVEEKVTASIANEVFCDKTKSRKIIEYSGKAQKDFEAYEQARIGRDIALESCTQSGNMEYYGESVDGLIQSDATISSWELLTETKISDKIPRDIQTKLASKHWNDRKETLAILCGILESNPRLSPDEDHSELIEILHKILEKDVNINVAAIAVKCIAGFANGLRYRFATFIPKIYISVFEKFKEKKLILREPLIELCDILALLTPLSAYIEAVEVALQKPNPQVKTQTALFLSRLLCQHNVHTLPLDCVRQRLGPALTKLSFDADPESREASLLAVGAIMRIAGENVVNNCCSEIMQDDNKSAKVRENSENLIRKFGLNASAPILKLHQKTKSIIAAGKVGSYKAPSAGARMKGSKCNITITKKMPCRTVISKSKFNSAMVPAGRIQSVRSAVSTASVEVKSGTDVIRNLKQNSSNERDVFFDAAEEMDIISHSSSDPDNSLLKNETYTVEKEEGPSEQCPDFEAATAEESIPLHSISREMKQSDTTNFIFPSVRNGDSRLPTPTLRGVSGSRIPIPVHRRT